MSLKNYIINKKLERQLFQIWKYFHPIQEHPFIVFVFDDVNKYNRLFGWIFETTYPKNNKLRQHESPPANSRLT